MLTGLFTDLFYTGLGTSDDVPGRFDVALNGVPFMLDTTHDTFAGGIQTIPLLREQADSSEEPGEASVNPEDLWPRSQHTWHKGAGQQWLDTDDGDRARFWNSRGVDCWTRGQIKTLPGTFRLATSADTNLALCTAGNFVYFAHGSTLSHFADITTNDAGVSSNIHAGEGASTVKSICSDGFRIYAAVADGVHTTLIGTTSATHFNDLDADLLGYAKGRLMAAIGPNLYNITTGPGAPTAHFTHPNTDWEWTCFAEGGNAIYAGGYSGDKSAIYSITIKEDGTGLDVPKVAGRLPDGEIVRSIQGYLGYVVIGTDNGWRVASEDNNTLTFGALVSTGSPVLCFEPQDRFVWFGWSDFDDSFTGLGRMDLSTFTAANVPAYASDLMWGSVVTGFGGQGDVTGVATSRGRRVFCVAGVGLIRESDVPTAFQSPFLETSDINYGISDDKVVMRLAVEHDPLPEYGGLAAYISVDSGEYELVGSNYEQGTRHPPEPFFANQMTGSVFRLRFNLSTEDENPATLNRYTLRAYPLPSRGETIVVGLKLFEQIEDTEGATVTQNPLKLYNFVRNLTNAGRPIRYQERGIARTAFIDQIQLQRHSRTTDRTWWNAVLACKLKVLGE